MTQDEENLENIEEKIEPETEKMDFTKPDYQFIPKGCQYRQNGIYLVCYSCDLKHAVYIGPNKMMVGETENGPILVDRVEYLKNGYKKSVGISSKHEP